ncbi:MAG: hypothetical protein ABIV51_02055 [Saprospiraceae bacterium]
MASKIGLIFVYTTTAKPTMKNRLVLWGTNEKDEKVLIAMQLVPKEKMVDCWLFPAEISTEEFVTQLHQEWRNGAEIAFPEGSIQSRKELSISEPLLPAGIAAERDDLVKRAQTEWQFVVLSEKLHQVYASEIEDIADKIASLKKFDAQLWEDLRQFWDRVQNQVREKNMFRDHVDSLKEKTNELFGKLKDLRKNLEKEFNEKSGQTMETVLTELKDIEAKIEKGLSLQPLFAELKNMQQKFREMEFTRDHRSKIWDRLDAAFKAIKEKRFGKDNESPESKQGAADRIQRRYVGLMDALDKMQKSIDRDQEEFSFQSHKVESSDGQLESQLRQAKINMIEERISSKRVKLDEMHATREQLEKKLENLKEKENEKLVVQKREEAKKQAEIKIKEEIKIAAEARKEAESKLEKAASAITGVAPALAIADQMETPVAEAEEAPATKVETAPSVDSEDAPEVVAEEATVEEAAESAAPKEESLFEAITDSLSESLQDLTDTVKAAAGLVAEKIEKKVDQILEKKDEEE